MSIMKMRAREKQTKPEQTLAGDLKKDENLKENERNS